MSATLEYLLAEEVDVERLALLARVGELMRTESPSVENAWEMGMPSAALPAGEDPVVDEWRVRNLPNVWRGWRRAALANELGITTMYGSLDLTYERNDGSGAVHYGLASMRVVTTVGVQAITDAFQPATGININIFKYHGWGTGPTAENQLDTQLDAELNTEYATSGQRPLGTQTETSFNVYATTSTLAPSGSGPDLQIAEHGLFSVQPRNTGLLLDRSVFSPPNPVQRGVGSLIGTYSFTTAANG